MASDAVSANTVARSYSDTVINTVKNDTMLNANIYDINQYIENIKKKYIGHILKEALTYPFFSFRK